MYREGKASGRDGGTVWAEENAVAPAGSGLCQDLGVGFCLCVCVCVCARARARVCVCDVVCMECGVHIILVGFACRYCSRSHIQDSQRLDA